MEIWRVDKVGLKTFDRPKALVQVWKFVPEGVKFLQDVPEILSSSFIKAYTRHKNFLVVQKNKNKKQPAVTRGAGLVGFLEGVLYK